jgi:hypothetical protein
MLKTTRKLKLNKEKLRLLVDSKLEQVEGGVVMGTANNCDTHWCSSNGVSKCYSGCNGHGGGECFNN